MSIHAEIAADAKRIAAAVPLIAPLTALVIEYRWVDQEVIDAAIAHECAGWQAAGPSGVEYTMERLEFQEAAARRVYGADIGGGSIFDQAFDRGDCNMMTAMMRRVGATGTALAGARICGRYPAQELPTLIDSNGFSRPDMVDTIRRMFEAIVTIHYHAVPGELKALTDGKFYAP